MKRMIFILALLTAGACQHAMSPWPSDSDKQEVAVYLRTRSLSTSSYSNYQLLVYDETAQKMSRYTANTDPADNSLLHVKLFPGSYTGFCVTNAEEDEALEYSENNPPEQIYLKSQKSSGGKEEAKDYLLGESNFQVSENQSNTTIFNLERKVGMLKVRIENIPDWLNDLQINLEKAPRKMNLRGTYSKETYTISKHITPPENGNSETTLFLFPPTEKSILTLSSDKFSFVTPERIIESIQANRITEIKAIFKDSGNTSSLEITTHVNEWEDQPLPEADWSINIPEGPCSGVGNGHNKIINPGFEETFTSGIPSGWKLDAGGENKQISLINTPVWEGNQAVRLEGKTYLYQDIAVSGGQCYQFKLYVNAPVSSVKWRYWYTWMAGSNNLPSDNIRSSSFNYQTEGYIDAFNCQIVKAPSNANKLRVEIRTYTTTIVPGEGLYVDGASIEPVN